MRKLVDLFVKIIVPALIFGGISSAVKISSIGCATPNNCGISGGLVTWGFPINIQEYVRPPFFSVHTLINSLAWAFLFTCSFVILGALRQQKSGNAAKIRYAKSLWVSIGALLGTIIAVPLSLAPMNENICPGPGHLALLKYGFPFGFEVNGFCGEPLPLQTALSLVYFLIGVLPNILFWVAACVVIALLLRTAFMRRGRKV